MNDERLSHGNPNDGEPPGDRELEGLLRTWVAPPVPASLDQRLIESYRKLRPRPVWRRLLFATIPVPVPVAVALIAVAVGALVSRGPATPPAPSRVADARALATKVDPPLVTRTSLAGFEPVADLTVTVIPEGRQR